MASENFALTKWYRRSIVFRVGILLISLVTVAMSAMLSSYLIADKAERDAEAVNLSGSIRMYGFHLLTDLLLDQGGEASQRNVEATMQQVESRINHPVLRAEVDEQEADQLALQYQHVKQLWGNEVKPKLTQHLAGEQPLTNNQVRVLLTLFVEQVDQLVGEFQGHAESRVETLRLVQAVALFTTFALVAFSLMILHRQVELPLRLLTQRAEQIGQGDFAGRVELTNQDELGILAVTLNRMTEQLQGMYDSLENKVEEKTAALQRSARSLNLLFEMAREINENVQESVDFSHWVDSVAEVTGIQDIELCLKTPEAVIPYNHIRVDDETPLPDMCNQDACKACMVQTAEVCQTAAGTQIRFPLIKDAMQFGVIVVMLAQGETIASWQHQLMQSFADQVTVALSLKNFGEQKRREALMNERNVIARELHDSLAQSLSYLKIQVTRMSRTLEKLDLKHEALDDITQELQEGIASAYRQLRELLTTFRLTISEKGLRAAVDHTVNQLREQHPSIEIDLSYSVDDIPFTPNEEIHLLQLVRESLQNATRHSKGNRISVELKSRKDRQVIVTVRDNGVGIPDEPDKMNHYGMAIMRERARNLDGTLQVVRPAEGGTLVQFEYKPDYWSDEESVQVVAVSSGR